MMYYAVRHSNVYSVVAVGDFSFGLRLHKNPMSKQDALGVAERAAIRSCAKASGGRKGQWRVVRHGDVFVKERVQP